MEEQVTRIREDLYKTRNSQKRWGIGLIIFGLVTLADSGSPFPVPLVGLPSIVVGLATTLLGAYLVYKHQELPISETLDVAALHQGFLSAPLLVRALHITPTTAERILADLSRRGYTRVEEQGLESGEVSYRVLGLNAPPVAPTLPPGEPGA